MQVPHEPLQARLRRRIHGRPEPVPRPVALIDRRRRGVFARVRPEHAPGGIEELERHHACIVAKVIVDDGAVWRILRTGLVGWHRRVGVHRIRHSCRHGRLEQRHRGRRGRRSPLAQRRHAIEDPESASMRGDRDIVVLHDQIADRNRRHVHSQRVPVIAVIEREPHLVFRSGIEQSATLRVLTHHVDGRVGRNAIDDFRPGLPAVARAVDVWPQIVEPEGVDGSIGRARIRVRCIHQRHLPPRPDLRRCHIRPRLAAIPRDVDQSIVRPRPDSVRIHVARRDRVHHAAPGGPRRRSADILADARWHLPRLAREVLTRARPRRATVHRLPHHVRAVIQLARIDRREQDRHRANATEVLRPCRRGRRAEASHTSRVRAHVLCLTCASVKACDRSAVDDVRVQRIRRNVAVLARADWSPVAVCDASIVAAARDACRA